MRIINLVFLIVISTILGSCKKDVGDCFKSTGEVISEFREANKVSKIILHDNINLILIPSDTTGIEITAGKNLLSKIKSDLNGDTLELSNTNSCNWVRDFSKEITAKVYVKDFIALNYRSIGNVSCADTIFSDSLKISVFEGSGKIDMQTVTPLLVTILSYGTVDIKVSGRTRLTYIYSVSWGLIDNRNITTEIAHINSNSKNDVYVNVLKKLSVEIHGIGNVYYKGNPSNISLDNPGEGKLIKLEE